MAITNHEKESLKLYLSNSSLAINDFIKNMDMNEIGKAKELILEAERNNGRVHITGIGKPGHVASYIASLLSSTGTPTYELHGTEAVHGSSGQVVSGDVVIVISNSGETEELKATVTTLKNNGAFIIGVTGNYGSWLAKQSDVLLEASVQKEGDTLNKAPRTSILAEMIVLQSLSVLLQYEKSVTLPTYLKWHPGGSLGSTIKNELSEQKISAYSLLKWGEK